MSKTKRDKVRGKYRAMDKALDKTVDKLIRKLERMGFDHMAAYRLARQQHGHAWDKLTYEEQVLINRGMSKSPSWWNRMFNRVPKRRQDRDMLKKITLDCEQDLIFTDDNKPHLYYW